MMDVSRPAVATSKKPRRFLPEPIETSSRSSKVQQNNPSTEKHSIKNRLGTKLEQLPQYAHSANNSLQHGRIDADKLKRSPRKFVPQLMETAKHSVRPGKKPSELDSITRLESQSPTDKDLAFDPSPAGSYAAQESRFSYCSLLRRQEARRHSFRVPDLPAIPSSCSEESRDPASPTSALPSASLRRRAIPADAMEQPGVALEKQVLQYILPFSLQQSETQLKEQALAAFPNEQVYQPVDHFAIDREEEEPPYDGDSLPQDPRLQFRINRRASSADLPFELEYLRRHKEEAGMNRRHYITTRGGRQLSCRSPKGVDKAVAREEAWEADHSLAQLRQAASPPMIGHDLIFPQSLTPATTISEDMKPHIAKEIRHIFTAFSGLWSADPPQPMQYECNGLWNGTCKAERQSVYGNDTLLPGFITPRHGGGLDTPRVTDELPQTGGRDHQGESCPATEKTRDTSDGAHREFNDGFVTQIYNYLSLGYPSVARYYDHELSKVSGVSVAALRADDLNTDAKGHVAVHKVTAKGSADGTCMRWTALRLYIQEWARQQPQMSEKDPFHETWGVLERKGSWAV
ncbi:hypothetical protein BJX64DRAFT_270205 [Aspergillus heterothallicus]